MQRLRALIIAVLCSVGQSQPLAPTPPIKSSQPKQPATSTQKESSTNERGSEQSPLVVKVLPPVKTTEETTNDKAKDLDQSSANWWMVRLTGAIAFIGFVQTIVFGVQARRLRQTVVVAQRSADALMYGERAWIFASLENVPDIPVAMPDNLAILWIKPAIRNRGRTPAHLTLIKAKIEVLPFAQDLPAEPNYEGNATQTRTVEKRITLPPDAILQPVDLGISSSDFEGHPPW
jgi:hypothetical protein